MQKDDIRTVIRTVYRDQTKLSEGANREGQTMHDQQKGEKTNSGL